MPAAQHRRRRGRKRGAQGADMENGEEYKTSLIQAIHKCASRYSEVADSIVLLLLDFMSGAAGLEILQCVKGILEQYHAFRPVIIRKIIDNFEDITTSEALRTAIWIIGEYGRHGYE